MYPRKQGINDARQAIDSYQQQIAELEQQQQATQADLDSIKKEKTETCQQLAMGLVTQTDQADVTSLVQEIGALHLPNLWQQIHAEREQWQKRITDIEQDQQFINADKYLHPDLGEWIRSADEYTKLVDGVQDNINHFAQAPYFLWLKKDAEQPEGLLKTLRSLFTFSWLTRKGRYQRCQQQLGELNTAFSEYDEALSTLTSLKSKQKELQQKIDTLRALCHEHKTLVERVEHFPELLRQKLQQAVAEHLQQLDYQSIKDRIRPEAIVLLGKLEALDKKHQHLQDQQDTITTEINDRHQRMNKVGVVLGKWQRSNKWMLSSDKSKWLVDVPANSARRTRRFCGAYQTQREAIVGFDNYQSYAPLFATGLMFSSFALFASEMSVDSYVARQTYSEYDELNEAPEDMRLEDAAMWDVMDNAEADNAALDDGLSNDADSDDIADES